MIFSKPLRRVRLITAFLIVTKRIALTDAATCRDKGDPSFCCQPLEKGEWWNSFLDLQLSKSSRLFFWILSWEVTSPLQSRHFWIKILENAARPLRQIPMVLLSNPNVSWKHRWQIHLWGFSLIFFKEKIDSFFGGVGCGIYDVLNSSILYSYRRGFWYVAS